MRPAAAGRVNAPTRYARFDAQTPV